MAAMLDDLKNMYERGNTGEYSHMIVKCDMIDMEDYPIYVKYGEDPRVIDKQNVERTMECYSYALGWELQSKEHRAQHWD